MTLRTVIAFPRQHGRTVRLHAQSLIISDWLREFAVDVRPDVAPQLGPGLDVNPRPTCAGITGCAQIVERPGDACFDCLLEAPSAWECA